MDKLISRRLMIETLAFAAAGGSALGAGSALADDLKKLDIADPAAKQLGYIENAAAVDKTKYPAYLPGSNCENCLQLQGKTGDAYRPCTLFSGKLVATAGWCSGWTAEM